jgi:predicted small secreted protein
MSKIARRDELWAISCGRAVERFECAAASYHGMQSATTRDAAPMASCFPISPAGLRYTESAQPTHHESKGAAPSSIQNRGSRRSSDFATNRRSLVCLAIVTWMNLLTGCAADTMRGYVGQDIRAVMLSYGPPLNEIDLGDGTRAFQWNKVSVKSTPVSTVTATEKDRKGRFVTQTQFVGGTRTVRNCLYTFLAAWDSQRSAWIATGFRQPSLNCAVGGLS